MHQQARFEMTWSNADSALANAEGWDIFEACDGLRLERDDEAMTFAGDGDAWLHVMRKANEEQSDLHVRAMEHLKAESPTEYARIINHWERHLTA
jgi:hypothetical protein